MNDLLLKYKRLNPDLKSEVLDFIDFLLMKARGKIKKDKSSYRDKILSVSVWTNEDLQIFDEKL